MPNMQNLVLKDRAATPANRTFVPSGIDGNGVADLVETNGVPVGNAHYTISKKRNGTGNYVIVAKLSVPVVQTQTVNGVSSPVIVRTAYAEAKFTFDAKSTTQERNDVVGMFESSFLKTATLVDKVLVDLEGVW